MDFRPLAPFIKPQSEPPSDCMLSGRIMIPSEEFLIVEFKFEDPRHLVEGWEAFGKAKIVRRHELWKNTCFEAFWKAPNNEEYYELNANLKGEWNIYRFESYRTPQPPQEAKTFRVDSIISQSGNLQIGIQGDWQKVSDLSWNLTAIVCAQKGPTSHWAWKHAKDKPDFHSQDCFQFID